jgi:hypothetical protein
VLVFAALVNPRGWTYNDLMEVYASMHEINHQSGRFVGSMKLRILSRLSRRKRIPLLIVVAAVILCAAGLLIYIIKINISPPVSAGQAKAIENYLSAQGDVDSPAFGGKVFTSVKMLGSRKTGNNMMDVYVYAISDEYFYKNGGISPGSGSGLPVAVRADTSGGGFKIAGYSFPGDGDLYSKDLRKLFPVFVRWQIDNISNGEVDKLEHNNIQKAKSYYSLS